MIAQFVTVWNAIVDFLAGLFPTLTELFYSQGELTFIGIMAIVMAGVSLILLVWNLIRSFFNMRG